MVEKTGVSSSELISTTMVIFIIEMDRLRGVFLKCVFTTELRTASWINSCGTLLVLLTFRSSVQ
jgi:hypothetical protein